MSPGHREQFRVQKRPLASSTVCVVFSYNNVELLPGIDILKAPINYEFQSEAARQTDRCSKRASKTGAFVQRGSLGNFEPGHASSDRACHVVLLQHSSI